MYWVQPVESDTVPATMYLGLSLWSAPSPMTSGAPLVDFAQKLTASNPDRFLGSLATIAPPAKAFSGSPGPGTTTLSVAPASGQ
jgi:hypothetical protein